MKAVLWSNVYSHTHKTSFAGGVWDINCIAPCIKASEYKGQTYVKVEVNNEKHNTKSRNLE